MAVHLDFFNDPTWQNGINGSTTLLLVSSLAVYTIQHVSINVFAWATIGFSTGFLAKKNIVPYNLFQHFERNVLIFEDRLPLARVVAIAVSMIVSLIFPILASVFAFCVGFLSGYVYAI